MSEPKKETVRIVLPPKREGQPLASTPRESAMVNLPPKPLAAPAAPSAPAAPMMPPPSIPKPPGALQPPAAPGIPKPPSFPGAPKPPGAPAAPTAPAAPAAVAPAAPVTAPKPANLGPAPVAVKPQPKKETAKVAVAPGGLPKPQATVRLQPRPAPSQLSSAAFNVQTIEPVSLEETTEEEIPMNFAIAAVALSVIALAVQILIAVA